MLRPVATLGMETYACRNAADWCKSLGSEQLPCSLHRWESFDFVLCGVAWSDVKLIGVNESYDAHVQYSTNSYLRPKLH